MAMASLAWRLNALMALRLPKLRRRRHNHHTERDRGLRGSLETSATLSSACPPSRWPQADDSCCEYSQGATAWRCSSGSWMPYDRGLALGIFPWRGASQTTPPARRYSTPLTPSLHHATGCTGSPALSAHALPLAANPGAPDSGPSREGDVTINAPNRPGSRSAAPSIGPAGHTAPDASTRRRRHQPRRGHPSVGTLRAKHPARGAKEAARIAPRRNAASTFTPACAIRRADSHGAFWSSHVTPGNAKRRQRAG